MNTGSFGEKKERHCKALRSNLVFAFGECAEYKIASSRSLLAMTSAFLFLFN